MRIYQRFDVDEETPVQYAAIYVTRWQPEWGEPGALFREADDEQQALFDAAPALVALAESLLRDGMRETEERLPEIRAAARDALALVRGEGAT